MTDIYQQIWNVDQQHAGLRAVRPGQAVDAQTRAHGYVVVDEAKNAGASHRLIPEVHIPDAKLESYRLVTSLFNNYTLDQTKDEQNFPDEGQEVQRFLESAHKSPPMEVARAYVAQQSGRTVSQDQWWAILERVWFEQFDQGSNRDLSGFEHVLVGEQKQGKVQGYHFWYKYYLDENFRLDDDDHVKDLIRFLAWKGLPADKSPEVVTLSYEWKAFDYQANAYRKLTKPVGGFWVGPSAEGLMAMGTIRCLAEAMAPKTASINGVEYKLPLFRGPNDRNLRTFYPEFVRMA